MKPTQSLAIAVLVAGAVPAAAQSFDFNTASDAGLTHYSPLQPFGAGGVFSFPGGNTYRIQAPSSPLPGVIGPARAGALVTGLSYSQFSVSVDLIDWDASAGQAIGLVARAGQLGLGTSDAYAFFVFPGGGVAINRFDNESAVVLAGTVYSINPAKDYRLEFTGGGSTLVGKLYDLADTSTPVATVSSIDSTYSSGFSGLLVAASVQSPTSLGDATFDNLQVAVPEPADYTLAAGVFLVGMAAWRRVRS